VFWRKPHEESARSRWEAKLIAGFLLRLLFDLEEEHSSEMLPDSTELYGITTQKIMPFIKSFVTSQFWPNLATAMDLHACFHPS
jgi:hypothetical protein